jgi:glycosyltransferase involved in cell wall biosynthesis
MRVVHIAKVKGIAGAERHLLDLVPTLASSGVDVQMLVLEDPRFPTDSFRHALEERRVPVQVVRTRRNVDPLLVGRIARRLRGARADIVHTHMIHADLYGLPAARLAGVRGTVSSRHDNNPFRREPVYRWLNERAMRMADRVVAISHAVTKFVVDVEGVDPRSVVTIHYGLAPGATASVTREQAMARLALQGDGPVVGVVGRLVEQKGIDVLIDAFPEVLRRHPAARLLVVGDGPEGMALRRRASRLGLDGRVVFAGWINNARDVMPACDVMVMPSRWEGLGLAALEAMACGRPLVASAVDALPEVVRDGETGMLVSPGDRHALAGAVNRLLDCPDWAAALGAAGQARVRDCFSVSEMVRSTIALYEQLCPRAGVMSPDSETAR